jgi:four helix bundle protein
MDLAKTAFDLAGAFPASTRFELGSQVRRAATSIPSNIAEGHANRGERTFLRHIRIALGSLAELDTQLELAIRLQFLRRNALNTASKEIMRTGQLLHGLERALKRRVSNAKAKKDPSPESRTPNPGTRP